MPKAENLTTSAGELVRQFSHYSDIALAKPVIVTKNGRPRNVLLSFEEYQRLRSRDRQAFRAADTPKEFVASIRSLAKRSR